MSKYLQRAAMALSIAALAFSLNGTVKAADEAAPAPKPKRHQFTGVVESIDAKAGSAVVKNNKEESKTFKIGEKTKYSTVDKKEATVTDIKIGDKVTVYYTEDAGVANAVKIGVPQSVAKKEKEEKKD